MPSIVKSLRILADSTRLRLLLLLQKEELSVVEIQEILGMGQSRISSQLAQLKRAGLVADRRVGKNVFYDLAGTIEDSKQQWLRDLVQAGSREIPEAAADRTALKLIVKKRQEKTREHFNKLAGKLG